MQDKVLREDASGKLVVRDIGQLSIGYNQTIVLQSGSFTVVANFRLRHD